MNTSLNTSKFKFNQILRQSLLASILSAAALASGWVPGLYAAAPIPVFGAAAQAQEISNLEITNYARAVLAIEPRREAASREIKSMASGQAPKVLLCKAEGINSLSRNIRGVAVNYCDQAKKIIENNKLTISRFNQITVLQQGNPAVKAQIQAELMRLQQSGNQ